MVKRIKGSGGQRRRGLKGKGPTPKAVDRVYHKAHKAAEAKKRSDSGRHYKPNMSDELVVGRNPVIECLHAKVPAVAMFVAIGTKNDPRLVEAVNIAAKRSIPIVEVSKQKLDEMTGNGLHQGIGLQIPEYHYADLEDLITHDGMVVFLDNITDPRNLGAVIRSVAAFGADGVVIPERRSASVTAVTWRSSAGTAARVPVAKVTNMTRALKQFQEAGYQAIGLAAGGEHTHDSYDGTGPVVIVVGSEGKGLSRLVKETCDTIVTIPMEGWVESLNASVAAGVVLAEFARQRHNKAAAATAEEQ